MGIGADGGRRLGGGGRGGGDKSRVMYGDTCKRTESADQNKENEEDSAVAAGPSGLCLFHFSHRWSSTVSRPAARS